MKHVLPVLFLLIHFLAVCQSKESCYVGGIQINEPDQKEWAHTLKSTGFNLAQVTAYAKQGAWNTDHLWWEWEDTSAVINEIRALKSSELHVIMVLRVALQHEYDGNKFKWHGMIYPQTDAQRKEWFRRYSYFVRMWSQICEREGVDILAIGSELNALFCTKEINTLPAIHGYYSNREAQEQHELRILEHQHQIIEAGLWEYGQPIDTNFESYIKQHIQSNIDWSKEVSHGQSIDSMNHDRAFLNNQWKLVIRQAREVYNGQLTIASNYDNYSSVGFWKDLDFIGINAYFPLRSEIQKQQNDTTKMYTDLKNGWTSVFNELESFKKNNRLKRKPLFFTELGYSHYKYCTIEPWKGYGYSLLPSKESDSLVIWNKSKNNKLERSLAIKALREVSADSKVMLKGLSYWKLSSFLEHEKIEPFSLILNNNDPLETELLKFLK